MLGLLIGQFITSKEQRRQLSQFQDDLSPRGVSVRCVDDKNPLTPYVRKGGREVFTSDSLMKLVP